MAVLDATMNTNLHHAFAREILRLRDGVGRAALADPEKVAGLKRRYEFFSSNLHHHHEGEDRYLWPGVRAQATPSEAAVLDAMEAEHGALAKWLGALDDAFANLGAQSDKDAITGMFDHLQDVFVGHCEHEERDGVPIVQRYLSDDSYKAFMKYNRTGSMLVFPWVCDGATPQEVTSTWGVLPPPLRLFLKPITTRRYRRFSESCGV